MEKRIDSHEADESPYLQELTSQFNKAISNGESFGRVKKIYMKIKSLETHLRSLKKDIGTYSNPWLIH